MNKFNTSAYAMLFQVELFVFEMLKCVQDFLGDIEITLSQYCNRHFDQNFLEHGIPTLGLVCELFKIIYSCKVGNTLPF